MSKAPPTSATLSNKLLDLLKAKEKEIADKTPGTTTNIPSTTMSSLGSKFGTGGLDFIEEHLQSTGAAGGVGLVSKQEYKMRRERVELAIAEEEEKMVSNKWVAKMEQKQQDGETKKKKQIPLLSFQDEEEEGQEESLLKKRSFRKNPDVNTRFLKDSNR